MQLHPGTGPPPALADGGQLRRSASPVAGTAREAQAPEGHVSKAFWWDNWNLPQLPAQDTAQGGCGSLRFAAEEHSPGKEGVGPGGNSEDGCRKNLGASAAIGMGPRAGHGAEGIRGEGAALAMGERARDGLQNPQGNHEGRPEGAPL